MFNLREYRASPDRLTDLLPWAALVAPGVVLNKDGSFQRSIAFRGPDVASSTEEQLVALNAGINNSLKRLGSGWAFYIEARRKSATNYPKPGHFPDPISQLVDLERRTQFNQEKNHFESEHYLTLQFLPPRDTVSRASRWFYNRASQNENRIHHKQLNFFINTSERFLDILKDYLYIAKFLDDAQTLTYLHKCISERSHVLYVPKIPMYLDAILADTPLVGGLEPKLGKYYLRTVSILGFPSQSQPAILDRLNQLPLEYRYVTRFLPLDKLAAEKIIKNYKRRWFAKRKSMMTIISEMISKGTSMMIDTSAVNKSQDAEVALQSLEEGHVAYGYYTATITVWDEDPQVADAQLREIERVINGLGFTTINETVNAVEAWLSSLPGQAYANVRMPVIHTLNLAHLLPFSAAWAGPQKDKHLNAPPLLFARTQGCTPFRLVNHVGDVGHQMIIGPTGSGKSVLLNVMAMQFLRYRQAQVFIFDKGGSFLAATMGVGGSYHEVGNMQQQLVFQPLRYIDDERERVFASEWVQDLLEHENVEVNPDVKQTIWEALTNLSNVPTTQRTLTGLKGLLQDNILRQAIERYTISGPYGSILDAAEEVFEKKFWQCFDLESLMDTPDIIPPVLSYIFHRLEQRFTGQPTLLILDEAWLYFDHSLFSAKIKTWLKTLRKLNVSVLFATQSGSDVLDSDIVSTLIESCPSRIFLPNARVQEPSIRTAYLHLGLNERQLQILSNAVPKRQYYFASNQGTCLFDLDLGPIALAFTAVNKVEEKLKVKQLLFSDYGNAIKVYLEQVGLKEAISLLDKDCYQNKQ